MIILKRNARRRGNAVGIVSGAGLLNVAIGAGTVPTVTTASITSPAADAALSIAASNNVQIASYTGTDENFRSELEVWTAPSGTGSLAFSTFKTGTGTTLVIPGGSLSQPLDYYLRTRWIGSRVVGAWSPDIHVTTVA